MSYMNHRCSRCKSHNIIAIYATESKTTLKCKSCGHVYASTSQSAQKKGRELLRQIQPDVDQYIRDHYPLETWENMSQYDRGRVLYRVRKKIMKERAAV